MECSNTGNIYGIYDLTRAKKEWVAAYYSEGTSEQGTSISSITAEKKSDQYLTAYKETQLNYAFIMGDATYETSGMRKGWGATFSSDNQFILRGYNQSDLFNVYYGNNGKSSDSFGGYRVCAIVK